MLVFPRYPNNSISIRCNYSYVQKIDDFSCIICATLMPLGCFVMLTCLSRKLWIIKASSEAFVKQIVNIVYKITKFESFKCDFQFTSSRWRKRTTDQKQGMVGKSLWLVEREKCYVGQSILLRFMNDWSVDTNACKLSTHFPVLCN